MLDVNIAIFIMQSQKATLKDAITSRHYRGVYVRANEDIRNSSQLLADDIMLMRSYA